MMNQKPRETLCRFGSISLGIAVFLTQFLVLPAACRAETPAIGVQEFVIRGDDGVGLYGWVRYAEPLEPRPVILWNTIYGDPLPREGEVPEAATYHRDVFGEADFNLAVVHVRGAGASEGQFDLYGARTKADATTIAEFVSNQAWSSGRILAFGLSGYGLAVFDHAVSGHPAIEAAIPFSAVLDHYRDVWWEGGTGPGWTQLARFSQPRSLVDPRNLEARRRLGIRADIVPEQVAEYERVVAEAATRPLDGEWWRERSTWEELPTADIPILLVSSFYDLVSWSPYTSVFPRLSNAWLTMGWGHDGPARLAKGYAAPLMRRFARRFLLDEPNGFDGEKRLQIPVNLGSPLGYAFGRVLWREADQWPLEETQWTRLYLRSGRSGSAASLNDGTLNLQPPGDESADVMPVSAGGYPHGELRLRHWAVTIATGQSVVASSAEFPGSDLLLEMAPDGVSHGDLRSDEAAALTFTTAPFEQNLEVSGPVTLTVFARSTAPDFVWIVRLSDVWPDGRSMWVSDLKLRASMSRVDEAQSLRNLDGDIVQPHYGFTQREPVSPWEIRKYVIHAGDVANVFRAGHRLRIDLVGIGSASPDAPLLPAVIELHHSTDHPSSALLPVIPSRCQGTAEAFPDVVHPGPCAGSFAEALAAAE